MATQSHRSTRKVGPAIHWQPADDAYFRLAELLRTSTGASPIHVVQDVLADIEAQHRASGSPYVFGLLIGNLCAEPRSGSDYVLIDEVMHAPPCMSGGEAAPYVAANLSTLAAAAVRRGKVPIGWYRAGLDTTSAKAPEQVALHRSLFPEPWQVMLALEAGTITHGTFVRVEPADGRPYSVPFFEVLPRGARTVNGKMGTVIEWENYHTTDPVVRFETLPAPTKRSPVGPERSRPELSQRRGFVERFTSLGSVLRLASEQPSSTTQPPHVDQAPYVGTVHPNQPARSDAFTAAVPATAGREAPARTTASPTVTPSVRPARPPVTFPMLVPPPPIWDSGRSRNALRWGVAAFVVALVVTALLVYRAAQ